MLKARLLAGGGAETLYVDDVFSAYTYTGTGTTLNIVNGIDLAGKGGMVWTKQRAIPGTQGHALTDSARGLTKFLQSNSTAGQATLASGVTSFNSAGFSLGSDNTQNTSGASHVSWTFRKAPKFFDVVTWTGNGANRTISHSLGSVPGMIVVKLTSSTSNWHVYHQSIANTEYLLLNTTAAKATDATLWNSSTATSSVFSLGTNASVNQSGQTYVAYLFAHDAGTDGIIQCGSFTTDGSGNATVSLGWEPQYLMVKASSTTSDWWVADTSRGLVGGGTVTAPILAPNTTVAEGISNSMVLTATGFTAARPASQTYIYLAIRRPNKPPTVGTQVYNAIARTGTGAAATVTGVGFAPDLVMPFNRSGVGGMGHPVYDRLRGALKSLRANITNAEYTDTASLTGFGVDGITVGADGGEFINSSRESSIINHFFKRAPGVFDQICFSGTGANKTESHGLTVAPELWLVKDRSGTTQWVWGSSLLANTEKIVMPTPAGKVTDATAWNSTYPTSSVLSLGTAAAVNTSAATYVAYLWATKAGISKVFGYTGDGASGKVINCGFTTGARFILIVRTDTAGSVFVWDTIRGIIAGNDPRLCLDTTAAEVTTDDTIDPDTSGFIVNQVAATNVNVTSATYIGLAYS